MDKDDVYFRFGGAILSDMHHSRYKLIRSCETHKIVDMSLQIDVLHAINTKDKSNIVIEDICIRHTQTLYLSLDKWMSALRKWLIKRHFWN